jgi:hypothetical protein
MRDALNRLGLANLIVGVIAVVCGILILGAGFDFDVEEMLEILATLAGVTAALGAFALAAYLVGLLLDAIEKRTG